MLGEDEIRYIFSDEEEEIQAGDIVASKWLVLWRQLLQKGGKFCFTELISGPEVNTSLSDRKIVGFAHLGNSHVVYT